MSASRQPLPLDPVARIRERDRRSRAFANRSAGQRRRLDREFGLEWLAHLAGPEVAREYAEQLRDRQTAERARQKPDLRVAWIRKPPPEAQEAFLTGLAELIADAIAAGELPSEVEPPRPEIIDA